QLDYIATTDQVKPEYYTKSDRTKEFFYLYFICPKALGNFLAFPLQFSACTIMMIRKIREKHFLLARYGSMLMPTLLIFSFKKEIFMLIRIQFLLLYYLYHVASS
ncbi:hypothetical protein ACJX0J_020630, partial [Zea mays]